MNKQMVEEFNKQINEEFFSAYLYLAIAEWSEFSNYKGAAVWFKKQANEEVMHAMKFISFLNERGAKVELGAIKKPEVQVDSLLSALRTSLKHEQHITARIYELFELALKHKDYPSQTMLHWFIDEQMEEESSVSDLIAKIELAGSSSTAIMFMDSEMGKRA